MKQTPFCLGLIALMMSTSTAAEPETAEALIAKGQELYSGHEYDLAAKAFQSAIELDSCPKSAHYLLARSLAMNAPDREQWDEAFEPTCNALAMAIKLNPEAARKASSEWDFIHIRMTPRFQSLIGANLGNPDLVKLLLFANGIWYSQSHGVWSGNDLLFLETGEVLQRIRTLNEEAENIFHFHNGRFTIDDKGGINITFESDEKLSGKFTENGTLELKGEKTTNFTCYPVHDV